MQPLKSAGPLFKSGSGDHFCIKYVPVRNHADIFPAYCKYDGRHVIVCSIHPMIRPVSRYHPKITEPKAVSKNTGKNAAEDRTTLLELHNSEKYEHLVNSLVPRGRRAKICDIGTSCGFMAIVAARMGREVSNVNICISFQYQTWEKQNVSVMTLITDNRRGFIKV